ncbi:DMT family transporter [Actinokineospora sp. HUAS TT18]|uniref:DMT family transporter n=1 Tax=Actinokineospora sp. HUAS TT18 TaxID=3447451 RepID=UPI003F5233CD
MFLSLDPDRAVDRRWLLAAVAGPVLFASAWVLIVYLPPEPLWNAVFRVLPAGLVLLGLGPSMPSGRWWRRSLLLGALNFGVFFGCQAAAVHRIPVGVAATIAATQAVLVSVGATVAGERFRLVRLACAMSGVVGVGLMVLRSQGDVDSVGIAAAVATALSAAAGMLLTRRWGLPPGVHHGTATSWQMLGGALVLVPLAWLVEGAPQRMSAATLSVTAWIALAGTATAFWLLYGALHAGVAAVTVSRLMLLGPLLATALSWLLLGQELTPLQLCGIVLVLIPIVAATRG